MEILLNSVVMTFSEFSRCSLVWKRRQMICHADSDCTCAPMKPVKVPSSVMTMIP